MPAKRGRPKSTTWPPKIYPHKAKGLDRIRVTLADGAVADRYLGPIGSEESRRAYLRIVAEMEAHGGKLPIQASASPIVAEVAAAYHQHARERLQDVRELHRVKTALEAFVPLFGRDKAADLSGESLEVLARHLVRENPTWSRNYLNKVIGEVRKCMKWAQTRRMVPADVVASLYARGDLRRDEIAAVELPDVPPANPDAVALTLPKLSPILAAMVGLQQVTGMRPGEVCALQPRDVDRNWKTVNGVALWVIRFDEHKTAWRGHKRWVVVGPAGQKILAPYLERDPNAYCFSPAEARAWWEESRRKPGSKPGRRKSNQKRKPGSRYTTESYARAVRKACIRAGVEPWSPNQIRHLVGTEVRRLHSLDHASCVLGNQADVADQVYARRVEKAAEVMAKMG